MRPVNTYITIRYEVPLVDDKHNTDNLLAKYNKEPIECIFQEPIFTESDKRFITDLGHTIVESPAAYERIDQHTLLIGVHLYRPIYAEALKSCLPAIFIGTGWDVWDTYAHPLHGAMQPAC